MKQRKAVTFEYFLKRKLSFLYFTLLNKVFKCVLEECYYCLALSLTAAKHKISCQQSLWQ
jgi:hypothetical protein